MGKSLGVTVEEGYFGGRKNVCQRLLGKYF